MVYLLDQDEISFPHPSLSDEDGLLAINGDLSIERLLLAYQNGIFPWYDEESPICWYSPKERFVLFTNNIKISKSLKQVIKSRKFKITYDQAFKEVIDNCAYITRKDQDGTWIIEDMKEAYLKLHQLGFAHSVEIWEKDNLVGGLYGIQIGKVFSGESMFSKISNTSKLALYSLSKDFGLEVIDCQVYSDHLNSMGAVLIPQEDYLSLVQHQQIRPNEFQSTLQHP